MIFLNLDNNKEDPGESWEKAVVCLRLCEHARQLISCFYTTYPCEYPFSYLTQIKYHHRNVDLVKEISTNSLNFLKVNVSIMLVSKMHIYALCQVSV